jgi:hypothetical protein
VAIQAGQSIHVGQFRAPEGDAVAAVCCCRTHVRLMLKRQTLPWLVPNAVLACLLSPEMAGDQGGLSIACGAGAYEVRR